MARKRKDERYIGGKEGSPPVSGGSLIDSGVFNLGGGSADGVESGDSNWDDVVVLLDGTSVTNQVGSNNYTNAGTAGVNQTTTGTGFTPEPTIYTIDRNSTGYLSGVTGSLDDLDSSPFTIEAWFRVPNISTGNRGIFTIGNAATFAGLAFQVHYSNVTASVNGYNTGNVSKTGVVANTWHHVALVYDGTDTEVYLDGVGSGSPKTATANFAANSPVLVGRLYGNVTTNYGLDGDITQIRITEGIARYTADFDTDDVITNPAVWPTEYIAAATRPTRRWGGMTGRDIKGGVSLENTGIMTLAEHYQSIPPGDGLSAATAGDSAFQILTDYPSSTDGIYYIKDGAGTKQVYCDMTNGGWMLYTSFATNSTYDATTYPAWNGNRIGAADMRGGSPQYGWTDNSENGRDGTTTWGTGSGETQLNGNDGPVYMLWNYSGTEEYKGVEMTQWNGPSSISELRVGWGKGASTFSGANLANHLLVNNTDTANSPKTSQSDIIENVSFNPTGSTPLLLCYERDGTHTITLGINGISSVWMR